MDERSTQLDMLKCRTHKQKTKNEIKGYRCSRSCLAYCKFEYVDTGKATP